jgi:hypothetical protein
MQTIDLKNLDKYFQEKISYCQNLSNFKLENDLIEEKLEEINNLKEQINSLNNNLLVLKSKISDKDNIVMRLQYEKKIIIEDNNSLRKNVKYLEMREIVRDIFEKSFSLIEKESSDQKEDLKLNEFILKNSKEKLVMLKKNLMNSTKKRKKKNELDTSKLNSIKDNKETNEFKKKKNISGITKKKENKKSGLKSNEDSLKKSLKNIKKNEKKTEIKKQPILKKMEKKTSNNVQSEKNDLYNFSLSNSNIDSKKNQKLKNEENLEEKDSSKSIKKYFIDFSENSAYKTASFISNEIESLEKKTKVFLRIKKDFPINSFEIIKKAKKDFNLEDIFFRNDSKPQIEIHKLIEKSPKTKKHQFYITLGTKTSGKIYTFQGYKNEPGLLPKISEELDYKKGVFLQIYDLREDEIFDYLKNYQNKLGLQFVNNYSDIVKTVKIENPHDLNQIFKVIFTKRINLQISHTLFVRFIKDKNESITLIDCEEFLSKNLKKLKVFSYLLKQDYSKLNNHILGNLLLKEYFEKAHSEFLFYFFFHLESISEIENNTEDFKCMFDFFNT